MCRTLLTQTATINVTAFPLLNGLLERLWIGQYESTVAKVLLHRVCCLYMYTIHTVTVIIIPEYRVEKALNL